MHVVFLDRRDDPENSELAVYLATSTDGGATFGPNVRVSESGLAAGGTFEGPNTWLGDYIGGAGAGGANHIVWSDGRTSDQDIYYRRVDDDDFDETYSFFLEGAHASCPRGSGRPRSADSRLT